MAPTSPKRSTILIGSDALRRVVQDLHDLGDHDNARTPANGCWRARGRRQVGRQALRRGFHQRSGSGEVRHRHRQHVRVLGLAAGATQWSPRSACRRCWRSARITFGPCSTASTRWTKHFRTAPFAQNLPVLMGLLGIWNTNFLGAPTVAVLPCECTQALPAYLQQLTMESNGKHVTLDGDDVSCDTAPIYWESPHQRPALLLSVDSPGDATHPVRFHRILRTAQPCWSASQHPPRQRVRAGRALAFGKTPEEVRREGSPDWLVPHRTFQGNRPSTRFCFRGSRLPHSGTLVRSRAHCHSGRGLERIDSFDQWGVELECWRSESSRARRPCATATDARQLDERADQRFRKAGDVVVTVG